MGKSKRYVRICGFSLVAVFVTGICGAVLLELPTARAACLGRVLTASELLGTFGDEKCKLDTLCTQGKVISLPGADKCRLCSNATNAWIMCCPFGDEGDWCTTKLEYSCVGETRWEGPIDPGSLEDCGICDSDDWGALSTSCTRRDARDEAPACD